MSNRLLGSGVLVAVLASISGTAWCFSDTTATTLTAIAGVAAACAAEPMRGTVYYYCDCGVGAAANCVAGNDANAGTDPAAPRRTITDAVTRFGSLTGTNTIAFCKGGAFDSSPTYWHSLDNSSCAAGTTCNDLREYSPTTFASSAKPIINNAAAKVTTFAVSGNKGGVRLLNLALKGDSGTIGNANWGVFLYAGAHDVTMCNVDMDAFDLAVYNAGGNSGVATTNNIKLIGNHITNSRSMGFLGAGQNAEVSYNYWDGNGSSNMFDHTIYFGASVPASNVKVIGNYIHGQYGPTCLGVVIVGHGMFDYLTVSNNHVEIDAASGSGGCYGIGFGDGGYTTHTYFRHAIFSGNTLKNTGNASLVVGSCPDCLIENNLIIQDWDYTYPTTGIVAPADIARVSPADDVSDRNIIRNNTIWFGPRHVHGALGIDVRNEGTGHIVANNTVYYSSTSTVNTWGGVICYDYPLALSAYAFINNNHCYSAATYKWEATRGSLAAWRSYAGSGFDTASFTGDPLFVSAGSDFSPTSGSPLIGAGNALHGALLDITGATRPNPPTIGAFEPAGPGTLSIQTSRKVSEGAPSAQLRVNRIGGAIGAVGVSYATSNGTALAGADYTATSGTLAWADGDGNPKFINIPILHDTVTEPAKTFSVTLSNLTGSASLGNSLATVTLYDDDPATLFLDTANSSFLSYINAIYGAGITTGCGGGNYCPTQSVTRAQMAAFLIRGVESDPAAGYCGSTPPFADVLVSNTFCGHIKRLKELAITTGCGSNNYCPNDNVPRDQMAAFIVRAVEGEPAATYCGSGSGFADVAQTNGFCRYIKRLAELNITTGCGGGNFCPAQTVTREQMAAFIARAFLGM